MTSGYPEEDCSLDIEGYLDPNSFPPHQKEKQLDTIPEDESGYLLANHLPIASPDKVIQDDESKQVLVKDVSDKIVPTTNELQDSKDSTEIESDVSKEEVVANGLNHNPHTEESSGEVTENNSSPYEFLGKLSVSWSTDILQTQNKQHCLMDIKI